MKETIGKHIKTLITLVEQGQRHGYKFGGAKLAAYNQVRRWHEAFGAKATESGFIKFYYANKWDMLALLPSPAHRGYQSLSQTHYTIINHIENSYRHGNEHTNRFIPNQPFANNNVPYPQRGQIDQGSN